MGRERVPEWRTRRCHLIVLARLLAMRKLLTIKLWNPLGEVTAHKIWGISAFAYVTQEIIKEKSFVVNPWFWNSGKSCATELLAAFRARIRLAEVPAIYLREAEPEAALCLALVYSFINSFKEVIIKTLFLMSIIWEHWKTLVQVLRLQIISDTNNQTPTWVLGLYYLI